jgi:RNA polymerase primary sigma factor
MNRLSSAKTGDWSALDSYLRDVAQYPNLSDEETFRLGAVGCQGDVDAQEKLVKSHLRLVVKIAHQYAGFGLPLADLIAEGNLGLIRAAELYNPKFGTRFLTYASVWIKQRIHRAITSQARAVRIPVWRSQRLRKLIGISTDELSELRADRIEVMSLDAPAAGSESESDARPFSETFADENAEIPGGKLGTEELQEEMIACLHELEDRELTVLSMKFGLKAQPALSFRELGRRMGVSHEWVRRIAELAIVKARRAFEAMAKLPPAERNRRRSSVMKRVAALSC